LAVSEKVPVEPTGCRLRIGGVLLGQGLAEPVEHRQGLVAAAARRQGRHQRPLCALMKGVSGGRGAGDVDHLGVLPPIRQHLGVFHEQAEMAFSQGLAWALGPFLEPVLGQQVTAVQLGRRPVVLRVPGLPGPPAGGIEGLGVEPRHGALRQQHHVVTKTAHGVGGAGEYPPGDI
jgi:hypothetical protein